MVTDALAIQECSRDFGLSAIRSAEYPPPTSACVPRRVPCDNSDQVTACVKERSTAVAWLYGRADLQIARIVGNAGESVSRCQLKPWLPWRERAKGDSPHEFCLENRPNCFDPAVQGGARPSDRRMADLLLDVRYGLPGIGLDQRRFSSSVAKPSWTIRLPERILGLGSPRFSHSRSRAASS